MRKSSNNKQRAISTIFNLAVFGLLVACFAILLWQLPNKAAPAAQTQTAGQVAPAATVIEVTSVPVEDGTPLVPAVVETVVFTMSIPSTLGVVIDEKLAVILIEPGSAAEKAGVQLGDILERIEDIPLIQEEDRIKAKYLMNDINRDKDKVLSLTVTRVGKPLQLPFVPAPPMERGSAEKPQPTITPVWPPYDYL